MPTLAAPRRRPPPSSAAALAERFGGIAADRVLPDPPPGTATEADLDRVRRETGRLCELLDGTLVEKAEMSWFAGSVAAELILLLGNWLNANPAPDGRRRGFMAGADGFVRLNGVGMVTPRLRAPDVSYVSRDRFPGGVVPRRGYPTLAPDLVVEVLSPGNTDEEMRQKRANFFAAGTVRVWQIDPLAETAETFDPAAPDEPVPVPAGGTLEAGAALPGFAVRLSDLFTETAAAAGELDEEE